MTLKTGISLFSRQKNLLALLGALGGDVRKLDFQKLLFLYCQETGPVAGYEFVPYKFGAFSFTSYADWRKLIERGLLEADDHSWKLTPLGNEAVRGLRATALQMHSFVKKYNSFRGEALVAETYRRYPYYGVRSEIADKVLAGDAPALARIREARPKPGKAGIVTLGYEGRSLENYLNVLLKSGITVLCDVRRNPLSRKYGFSKGTLSKACDGVGIKYLHIPELGIASEQRQELDTQADYDRLFKDYELNSLPSQLPALRKIADLVNQGERVALTCYELLPSQCHRQRVASALTEKFGPGVSATHL